MQVMNDCEFADAVRPLERMAFSVAYLILGRSADCEDAMGAAVLTAYEKLGHLRARANFRAWFLQILRNECHGILRARQRVTPCPDAMRDAPANAGLAAADAAAALDLRSALLALPENQRVALLLQQEGYRIEEIAAILGVPGGTVKSRISRAKAALRLEIQEAVL